ncbi:MAG: ATP-binding protein [Paracoccaceae bacterium]
MYFAVTWIAMKRLLPDTLAARTLLVLILGLALSHAISIGLYISDRSSAQIMGNGEHAGDRIAVVDRLYRASPVAQRQELLALSNDPLLHVTFSQTSVVSQAQDLRYASQNFRAGLISHLTPDETREVRMLNLGAIAKDALHNNRPLDYPAADRSEAMTVSLSLPDGGWLNFTYLVKQPESLWGIRFALSMAVMLSAVLVLSVLVVHSLTRPLATFARAARRLGVDVRATPLPEGGSAEIREASAAFNEMQTRIRRYVEDRTQMIAAISHDLGTPIARMRLRAEYVDDPEQQEKMLADLDDMEKMVFSTLSFARDDADSEPGTRVDLRILLQRICNDAVDTGQDVTLKIQDDAVPFTCRPTALRRALSNLINNAVKYGQKAEVSCSQDDDSIRISILDDGPGIPANRREDVFKPFQRLEQSRNRETGGTGLGMTVARGVIRAHGGDIMLGDRDGGGLQVDVVLPR